MNITRNNKEAADSLIKNISRKLFHPGSVFYYRDLHEIVHAYMPRLIFKTTRACMTDFGVDSGLLKTIINIKKDLSSVLTVNTYYVIKKKLTKESVISIT